MDVRMLNKGRPFVIEMVKAKRSRELSLEEMKSLEERVNKSSDLVRISEL